MLTAGASKDELFKACRIIFGPEVRVSVEFLRYIKPIGLKAAYRKRAMETHPDRARALGKYTRDLGDRFRRVRSAYETLLSFVENSHLRVSADPTFRGRQKSRAASPGRKRPAPPPASSPGQPGHKPFYPKPGARSDHYYKGSLPKRNLLLGQFLYYSGRVTWGTLIDAIAWQRSQRPRIGQLARDWGIMSSGDVLDVLNQTIFNEKFGECARRLGYISLFEHNALIGRQRRLQRFIGEYFIEQGILTARQLAGLVGKQKVHNRESFQREKRGPSQ